MRFWPSIRKSAERQGHANVEGISVVRLLYFSPSLLLLFLACSTPVIYFSDLVKQHSYCTKVVRQNISGGITQDDADLKERCGHFDMNELFATARGKP
jgi:hypothetical protein